MSSKFNSRQSIGHNFLLSLETRGIKLGLSRTKKLLSDCNNPQKHIKSVQIIGTNGKGSTAAALSSILQYSGLRVGLYTSPHLVQLNERIQINNNPISNDYIDQFINRYQQNITKTRCTFFETLTALALHYFYDKNVDIAILETGLGGKYDSVTACNPQLQLFTSISKDHMHILGNSLKNIATNKAQAIQPKVPCISVKQKKVVQNILDNFAKKQNTTIDYQITNPNKNHISPLIGEHQLDNLLLAIKACKKLYNITDRVIVDGSKQIVWPGRIQTIQNQPMVIFDVSHNEQSIKAFLKSISSLSIKGKKILIISLQRTKNISSTASDLATFFDQIICTQLNERMYSSKELKSIFVPSNNIITTSQPGEYIQHLINNANKSDFIAIIGSHYWGKEIEKNFKISLVPKSDKL